MLQHLGGPAHPSAYVSAGQALRILGGEPALQYPAGQRRARGEPEPAVDMLEVRGDGPGADEQPPGDLGVAEPDGDQADHLQLPLRQLAGRRPGGSGRPLPEGAEQPPGPVGERAGAEPVEGGQAPASRLDRARPSRRDLIVAGDDRRGDLGPAEPCPGRLERQPEAVQAVSSPSQAGQRRRPLTKRRPGQPLDPAVARGRPGCVRAEPGEATGGTEGTGRVAGRHLGLPEEGKAQAGQGRGGGHGRGGQLPRPPRVAGGERYGRVGDLDHGEDVPVGGGGGAVDLPRLGHAAGRVLRPAAVGEHQRTPGQGGGHPTDVPDPVAVGEQLVGVAQHRIPGVDDEVGRQHQEPGAQLEGGRAGLSGQREVGERVVAGQAMVTDVDGGEGEVAVRADGQRAELGPLGHRQRLQAVLASRRQPAAQERDVGQGQVRRGPRHRLPRPGALGQGQQDHCLLLQPGKVDLAREELQADVVQVGQLRVPAGAVGRFEPCGQLCLGRVEPPPVPLGQREQASQPGHGQPVTGPLAPAGRLGPGHHGRLELAGARPGVAELLQQLLHHGRPIGAGKRQGGREVVGRVGVGVQLPGSPARRDQDFHGATRVGLPRRTPVVVGEPLRVAQVERLKGGRDAGVEPAPPGCRQLAIGDLGDQGMGGPVDEVEPGRLLDDQAGFAEAVKRRIQLVLSWPTDPAEDRRGGGVASDRDQLQQGPVGRLQPLQARQHQVAHDRRDSGQRPAAEDPGAAAEHQLAAVT